MGKFDEKIEPYLSNKYKLGIIYDVNKLIARTKNCCPSIYKFNGETDPATDDNGVTYRKIAN